MTVSQKSPLACIFIIPDPVKFTTKIADHKSTPYQRDIHSHLLMLLNLHCPKTIIFHIIIYFSKVLFKPTRLKSTIKEGLQVFKIILTEDKVVNTNFEANHKTAFSLPEWSLCMHKDTGQNNELTAYKQVYTFSIQ